jgi:hypothetical protein
MCNGEPSTVLPAQGWFKDRDLPSLSEADRDVLTAARDRVRDAVSLAITSRSLKLGISSAATQARIMTRFRRIHRSLPQASDLRLPWQPDRARFVISGHNRKESREF